MEDNSHEPTDEEAPMDDGVDVCQSGTYNKSYSGIKSLTNCCITVAGLACDAVIRLFYCLFTI